MHCLQCRQSILQACHRHQGLAIRARKHARLREDLARHGGGFLDLLQKPSRHIAGRLLIPIQRGGKAGIIAIGRGFLPRLEARRCANLWPGRGFFLVAVALRVLGGWFGGGLGRCGATGYAKDWGFLLPDG